MRFQNKTAVAILVASAFFCASANTGAIERNPEKKRAPRGITVQILSRSGFMGERLVSTDKLTVKTVEGIRTVSLRDLLSIQFGANAESDEAKRISKGLLEVNGKERISREKAVEELSNIGLPVLGPLLDSVKDTDLREPAPLYHLFSRVVPGYADDLNRTLDMIRMSNGETFRGIVTTAEIKFESADDSKFSLPLAQIRRIAVRRSVVERTFELHALRHCVQLEFLDSGVGIVAKSQIDGKATGYVRLSFNEDGWSSGPEGKSEPGPRHSDLLTGGFSYGALVGRVGAEGARWFAGKSFQKSDFGVGRLYFAVNDNEHWQNNIGSYRVKLRATNAYDLGDPQ